MEEAGRTAEVVARSIRVGVDTHVEAGHRPVGVGHSLGAVGRSLAGADIHTAAGSKLGHTIEQTDIRTSWLKMSIHTCTCIM